MKLTLEQVGTIEDMLTMKQEGRSGRDVIVKHGIHDLNALSFFYSVMRDLGVDLPAGRSLRPARAKPRVT